KVDAGGLVGQRRVGAVEFIRNLSRQIGVGRDVGVIGEQVVEGGGVGVARVDGADAEEQGDGLVHRRHVVVDAGDVPRLHPRAGDDAGRAVDLDVVAAVLRIVL